MITIDDVVDVVVEEATEDILKLSGTSGDDIQNNKLLQGSVFYALIHRAVVICNHSWWRDCIINYDLLFQTTGYENHIVIIYS